MKIYTALLSLSIILASVCPQTLLAQRVLNAVAIDDHKQKTPLNAALDEGFTAIEIECQLNKAGQLMCGEHLFEQAYLKEIQRRVEIYKGSVFAHFKEELLLFVKLKGDTTKVTEAFIQSLMPYAALATSVDGAKLKTGQLKVIANGQIARSQAVSYPYVFFSESCKEPWLDADTMKVAARYIPFSKIYSWEGKGTMPNMAYHSFISYVKNGKRDGRLSRVSQVPENELVWATALNAGADYIDVTDRKKYIRWRQSFIKD